MQVLNKILFFLDETYNNHPYVYTLFSGLGVVILTGLIALIKKHINKKNDSRHTKNNQPNLCEPQSTELSEDIQKISYSINHDLSYGKEKIFWRYFNKYKHRFSSEDVSLLENESQNSPDYTRLLCKLLGLIESLK